MAIDLHIHTTASDGSLSPREVVTKAKLLGLSVISITDHDTTDAISEAISVGALLGVEVVPGIEINTEDGAEEVHILGYLIDHNTPWLIEFLSNLKRKREERIYKIAEKLSTLNISIDPEEVLKGVRGATPGRPHVAKVMVDRGYVRSIAEAFEKYLGNQAPAYVPRHHTTPKEAIRVISEVGGVPVLAHPIYLKDQGLIPKLIELGLKGIECWHGEQNGSVSFQYLGLAKGYGLVVTGGSDYHGDYYEPRRTMGHPPVQDEIYHQLLSFRT